MRLLLIAMVVASLAMVGCKSSKTGGAEQAATVQEQFAKLEPGTKVGSVTAVLPDAGLLAATGLQDLAIGQTVVVLTPNQKIIAAGTVVEKTADAIHVRYDVNEKGRTPRAGDLIVKPAM